MRLANGWYQPAHADYVERAVRRHGSAGYVEQAVRRYGGIGYVERTDGTAHPRWPD